MSAPITGVVFALGAIFGTIAMVILFRRKKKETDLEFLKRAVPGFEMTVPEPGLLVFQGNLLGGRVKQSYYVKGSRQLSDALEDFADMARTMGCK